MPSDHTALRAFSVLPPSAREQIQFSTVCLSHPRYSCAGALVVDANQVQGIVSAKHHLCAHAGMDTPAIWHQDQVNNLAANFLDGLEVGYDFAAAVGEPGRPPSPRLWQRLDTDCCGIEFRNGYGRWDYDLMFICLRSPQPLRDYIAANPAHRIAYGNGDLAFYGQDMAGKAVFATGFGHAHALQIHHARVVNRHQQVRRQRHPKLHFTDVLSLDGAAGGGPVFHVAGNGRVYLLGATLDIDVLPDRPPPAPAVIRHAATALYAGNYLF
ncbi:hypothetical protein CXB49_15640 [Chromobacterium sp. ATCC 53434]|uniref:hypothetical protein n=1 Tax=Chromobacterium sp. (strain ATCC 53434 / SC 14030) TaxID=2059672 RepID=UPI000C76FCC7|nr:hypothetical protein [Chromobacterium sp. ATCC 53434]AUH52145.1 hypothetical protein CXB49_15640 [Chromobacterium sp. ATCC 53434]